jgi:hypothetical protein
MRLVGARSSEGDRQGDRELHPHWAPDGRIFFGALRGSKLDVWSILADGSGRLRHSEHGALAFPVPSPVDSRVACWSAGGEAGVILDAAKPYNGQRGEEMAPFGRPGWQFVSGAWSRDGREILGFAIDASETDHGLFAYDPRARRYRELLSWGGFPRWLSNGRRLLFHHDDRIFLFDTASGRTKEILSAAPDAFNWIFAVSSDDRWIYVSRVVTDGDVWVAELR